MSTSYDDLYRTSPKALGAPLPELVTLFEALEGKPQRVLDIGCGQGRDALFIARRGHLVLGVDISPAGIDQMNRDARAEGLNLEGIVADITTFSPEGAFDILLFDRVLHMVDACARAAAFGRLLAHVAPGGQVLIIDEPRNIPALEQVLQENGRDWRPTFKRRGFLFLRETSER